MRQMLKAAPLMLLPALLAACDDEDVVVVDQTVVAVAAAVETTPVRSTDDAADDPAIWINAEDTGSSRVLGTDKSAGLSVYDLAGKELQFLDLGEVNNVDLRQGLTGAQATLGATSNRSYDTLDLIAVSDVGEVTLIGRVPTGKKGPYGLCVARSEDAASITVFVNYKDGLIQAWAVTAPAEGEATATMIAEDKLPSQLEGCVAHEATDTLFVGEEAGGVWRYPLSGFGKATPEMFAAIGPATGLVADVEGMSVFETQEGPRLLVSSQGDYTYVVFDAMAPAGSDPLLKFRVGSTDGQASEATDETDGLEVTSTPLGDVFPRGMIAIQDGDNAPDAQNFKLVDLGQILDLITPHAE